MWLNIGLFWKITKMALKQAVPVKTYVQRFHLEWNLLTFSFSAKVLDHFSRWWQTLHFAYTIAFIYSAPSTLAPSVGDSPNAHLPPLRPAHLPRPWPPPLPLSWYVKLVLNPINALGTIHLEWNFLERFFAFRGRKARNDSSRDIVILHLSILVVFVTNCAK